MPEQIIKPFPANSNEAIAFLYVQQQDLKGKSPVEIHLMYTEALGLIKAVAMKSNRVPF
jgi:uncharacterized GH25 family protein